jgi:transposase
MVDAIETLPNDINELKLLIVSLRDSIRDIQFKLDCTTENYNALLKKQFGSSSEKRVVDPAQKTLEFDEAEVHCEPAAETTTETTVGVKSHARKKPGRKPIRKDIETIEIVHDLSDEEKACPCCGKPRPSMGEERTDEYELVPAHLVRKTHIRRKYGSCTCDDFGESSAKPVVIASANPKIVPKSLFSNSTIAFFITSKFCDAIPFYRMAKMLERYGLDVSRTTLCNLAVGVGRAIRDLIDRMWADIRGSPVVLMDETTLQVLNNTKGNPRSTCYMWVTHGFRGGKPVILFHYHSSRRKDIAERSLEGFSGFLQTDGYDGYASAGSRDGVTHVGCFAHIRRRFVDAKEVGGNPALAEEMLELIARVYSIERRERDRYEKHEVDSAGFIQRRSAALETVFTKIQLWLSEHSLSVAPQGTLGKAITYAIGHIDKAMRFVDHELLTPDTNRVENAIRPFVIGRKNWLFNNSELGAHASAALYSLIETAKANGHEPLKYLTNVFEMLPRLGDPEKRAALVPYVLDPKSY